MCLIRWGGMAVGIVSLVAIALNRHHIACSALFGLPKMFRLYVCNALILCCDCSKKSRWVRTTCAHRLSYLAALELSTSAWVVVAIYAKKAAVMAAFFVGEFSSRLRLFREALG